jgi:hypothetical protein
LGDRVFRISLIANIYFQKTAFSTEFPRKNTSRK